MSLRVLLTGLLLLPLLPALGVCSPGPEAPSPAASGPEGLEQPSVQSALLGRSWRLVEIVSMDDRVVAPDDRSLYTMTFKADGAVQIRADCNRGAGSWKSAAPGKLQFGKIAATQALCPPDSLHDRYLAQFPWVRSYVMKAGHLFLATMADGSIIEFEPAELPLAASVLGEDVRTSDASEMQQIVLTRIFDRYADEQGIEVSDAEIDAYVEKMRRGMRAEGLTAEDGLTAEEAAQVKQMRRDMGRSMIYRWKLNKSLYGQYRGRIIFQQFGPEPIDAYRSFLEQRQAAGDFTIHNASFKEAFWDYFINDARHSFYESGSSEEAEAFSIPPWEARAVHREDRSMVQTSQRDVPPSPDEGGPLHWEVTGVTTGLRLRAGPSTSAETLTTYPAGTVLNNLGCRRAEERVWCNVQPLGGGPRGFVVTEFLTPAISPNGAAITGPDTSALRAGRGEFDASGWIRCTQDPAQPMSECRFGVARRGGGYATVVVTRPNGLKRAIFFQMGIAIGADTSEADGYHDFAAEKQDDLHRILVGPERYEIPDAVVLGG